MVEAGVVWEVGYWLIKDAEKLKFVGPSQLVLISKMLNIARTASRTSLRAFSTAAVAAAPSWANSVTETIGHTPMVRLNKVIIAEKIVM